MKRYAHRMWNLTASSGARALAAACLLAIAMPGAAQPSQDERIRVLEQELEAIKASAGAGQDVSARIESLEQELAALKAEIGPPPPDGSDESPASGMQGAPNPLQDDKRYLTGDDLLDDAFPNSIPIPGGNNRLAIGGYAKLDFIQDLDYVGDRYEFELATIPVDGSPDAALGGRTTLHAKETRFNFDFRRRAHNERTGKDYPLQVFLELDFFEDNEALFRQPRLRHAYGVIGRFLAGQTWSISGDLEALAGLIDFSGGDTVYGDRVAQVRWQDRLNDRITWAAGVEDPKSAIANPSNLGGVSRQDLPNFAGRIRWTGPGGSHVQVGADLFELGWQGGNAGPSDSAMGYGINLTGRLLLGTDGKDALVAGASFGDGSSHRVISLEFSPNDAVITPNGLDVVSHTQVYVGYSHYWRPDLNSSFFVGHTSLDNSEFHLGSNIHQARSVHANLIWFPYPAVSTGFEVMWGERENKSGATGDAIRLQYMFKYKFN